MKIKHLLIAKERRSKVEIVVRHRQETEFPCDIKPLFLPIPARNQNRLTTPTQGCAG